MRVAALYDVHGNLPALEAVLAEVEREDVDRVVFGGDALSGPWPAETLARIESLGEHAMSLLGNADRELEPWRAERLGAAGHAVVLAWPLTVTLELDGLGSVLFCHATPRSDEEIITRITPDARIREVLSEVAEEVVVHGHVHVRYDRRVAGYRVVNPGSVGLPYEGRAGAFWALLGPDVEFRCTEYDVGDMVEAARRLGFPRLDEHVRPSLLAPVDPEEVTQHFEAIARGS